MSTVQADLRLANLLSRGFTMAEAKRKLAQAEQPVSPAPKAAEAGKSPANPDKQPTSEEVEML